ncbi:hypothetical protein CMUST_06795 [Corynebacterium mustelae]|uniref:Uncharacterized protein n=1 Tax=Corynebacterium mustelae TaxID=571915 RepID=A0A0G3H1L0_9CORY|nr:hypothetical protein [Corynebacterium mustelae]AKK05693.1 hypothetical protein CMUST_06795 [Corynebacterium mustelae]
MIADEFKSHELWKKLEEAKKIVEEFSRPLDKKQQDVVFSQVPSIAEAVLRHKRNSSALYSPSLLSEMLDAWSNLIHYLDLSNQGSNYIDSVQNYVNVIIERHAKWPTTFALKGGAVQAAVTSFENLADMLQKRMEFLEKEIHTKNQEIADLNASHSASLEELQEKIRDLEAQLEAVDDGIEDQENIISELSTKHNETFSEAQERRQGLWQEWLDKRGEHFGNAVEKELDVIRGQQKEGEETLDAMKVLRDEVEEVSGKAVEGILAKDYNSYALRDWVSGVLSACIGLAGILVAVCVLFQTMAGLSPHTPTSWQWTALKLTLTFLISAGSTVSFAFARQFFAQSESSKRIELELRAINPFLAGLGDKKLADDAKVKFIERAFGQPQLTKKESKSDPTNAADLVTILQSIQPFIGKGSQAN